jgi:hypothetical protein
LPWLVILSQDIEGEYKKCLKAHGKDVAEALKVMLALCTEEIQFKSKYKRHNKKMFFF